MTSNVLLPIARVALSPQDLRNVSFDAFFTHILMHELMHGLGPHRVSGTEQTVRQAMQEVGSALEEAKADGTVRRALDGAGFTNAAVAPPATRR